MVRKLLASASSTELSIYHSDALPVELDIDVGVTAKKQCQNLQTQSISSKPSTSILVSSERHLAESSATLSLRPVAKPSNLPTSMAILFGCRARFLL